MKTRFIQHSDHWSTPPEIYNPLNDEFKFTFDPCPLHANFDGLKMEWGRVNFINPPYSRRCKEAFILKAIEESKKGKICVMLLPVSTSTAIFHDYIKPNAKEIRFIRGRIRFHGINTKGKFVTTGSPMHDSMIVVF